MEGTSEMERPAEEILRLEGISRAFGEVQALDALTLSVRRGEFVSLLGPSGCGKTTALRIIAGFESPDRGTVFFNGRRINDDSPQRRGFGMVFQNYALFPHLSVGDNVAFGLRTRGVDKEEVTRRVDAALARVDLSGLAGRAVQALSGGQQQRVALARALAIEPPLLLLDEPLSNLDASLRERTRAEIRSLVKSLGITALFVTHDQEEAFDLSDRIALLNRGRLVQEGPPESLYRFPANRFAASFVGRAAFLPGRIGGRSDEDGRGETSSVELEGVAAPDGRPVVWHRLRSGEGGLPERGASVEVVLRPEALGWIRIEEEGEGEGEDPPLAGRVVERRYRGAFQLLLVELEGSGGHRVEVAAETGAPAAGVRVGVRPRGADRPLFHRREPG